MKVINDDFGGKLPPASQPDTTGFSAILALRLAPSNYKETKLIGAPHSKKTHNLLHGRKVEWTHREWMVDFYVVHQKSSTFDEPLIACESEAWTGFDVEFTFDFINQKKGKKTVCEAKNGYLWDFRKLLHFRAPHLLFVARVNRPEDRLPKLEKTLASCAKEYAAVWNDSQLSVVLLPSGHTKKELTRIGTAWDGASLQFENLEV